MQKEASNEQIVEYWETEQLPSMQKTSDGFKDLLKANYTDERLLEILQHPFLSREQIETQQLSRIKKLVKLAYNKIPFYRQKYKQVGFCLEDLQTWQDYHKLPYVTKDELIDAFPDRCVNLDYHHDDLFPTRSSGSSGQTLRIYVDPAAIITDTLQGIRQFWLQTDGKYNPDHLLTHVYTVPWWVDHLNERDYQNMFISSLIAPNRIGEILATIKTDILSLYPSNLLSLLPHLSREAANKLILAVTHSEMSSKQERARMAQILGVPVLDEYSSEELTRIALELPTGHYHVSEDSVRLDIVDPQTMTVKDTGTGLVVATNLLNEAMPFIRYVQGDYVTVGEQEPSPVNWKQIEKVEGRFNDSFVDLNGREIPAGTILDISYRWMFDIGINIQQFEIIQQAFNYIVVNLSEPTLADDKELEDESKQHLKKLLEYVLGGEIEFEFNLVETIEKKGKKRRPIRREFNQS